MNIKTLCILIASTFLSLTGCSREETVLQEDGNEAPVPAGKAMEGRLRIKFRPGHEDMAAIRTRGMDKDVRVTGIRRLFRNAGRFEDRTREAGLHLWYEVEFDRGIPVTRAISDLTDSSSIEYAEPVYSLNRTSFSRKPLPAVPEKTAADSFPTDDPMLKAQWHYDNRGELQGSVAGADINLFNAWKKTQGSRDVIVAVIDGGIDIRHEDLEGNVGNPAEINGTPGVDDDGNGYVDDCYGWNFVDDSARIVPESHGTHVAGTIGAENNNGTGVCGIAGGRGGHTGVWLLSCQILEERDKMDEWGSFAEAIKYAADAGAVIAQNSWGYNGATFLPHYDKEAIDYFIRYAGKDEKGNQTGPMAGGVVIFAGGNEQRDYICYPASYDKVFAVAAYASDFQRAWYSNFADWMDIAAPGGETYSTEDPFGILSTVPGNRYEFFQGTSMAAPHVSGIAALVVSELGGPGFTESKLLAHLRKGTRDIDVYNPRYQGKLGYGAADAFQAMTEDRCLAPEPVKEITYGKGTGSVRIGWQVGRDKDDGVPYRYQVCWSTSPLPEDLSARLPEEVETTYVPVPKQAVPGDTMGITLKGIRGETVYHVAVTAVDTWGNRSADSRITFTTPHNAPPRIIPLNGEKITLKYMETGKLAFLIEDPEGQDYTYEVSSRLKSLETWQAGDTVFLSLTNRRMFADTYEIRLTVTDCGFAGSEATAYIETLPNARPVLAEAFEPVWMGSLQEVRTCSLAGHFTDEQQEELVYRFDYDAKALKLESAVGSFKIRPLKYGPSTLKITAVDPLGETAEALIPVMCHDYREELTLYPNPVADTLKIRMGRSVAGNLHVIVTGLGGEKYLETEAPLTPYVPASLDLSALEAGTYRVEIGYGGKKWNRNIIKK